MTHQEIDNRVMLQSIRQKKADAKGLVERLEEEEANLIKLIQPTIERCRVCRGSGHTTSRDVWSGCDVSVTCFNCNGTGTWKEPI